MFDSRSDEERAESSPIPPHDHAWGQWWRPGTPGVLSNLFERDCKCGAWQIARGTAWGKIVKIIRTVTA